MSAAVEVAWSGGATAADRRAVGAVLASVAPMVTDPGPKFPVLYCSTGNYLFRDASGNMSMRFNCPYSNINWSWTMSPALLAWATGACDERGMLCTVNGVGRPMNKPHVSPCNYIFHGTLAGVRNADAVHYSDDIYFPVKGGTAHVHVFGSAIASRY